MKKGLCSDGCFVASQIVLDVVDMLLGLALSTVFANRHNCSLLCPLQERKRIANGAPGFASILPRYHDAVDFKRVDLIGHEQDRAPGPQNGGGWIEGVIEVAWILFAPDNDEIRCACFARNNAIGVIRNSAPLHVFDVLGGSMKLLAHVGEDIHHLPSLTIIALSVGRRIFRQKWRKVRPPGYPDQPGVEAIRQIDGEPDSSSVNPSRADMHHQGGIRHRFLYPFNAKKSVTDTRSALRNAFSFLKRTCPTSSALGTGRTIRAKT